MPAAAVDNSRLKPSLVWAFDTLLRSGTSEDLMPMIARRSFLIGTALAPLAPLFARAQASNAPAWPALAMSCPRKRASSNP